MEPTTSTIPEKRIKDVSAARTSYEALKKRDEQASKNRAQVRNQIEGGLPVPPEQLTKLNRAWESNDNDGTARADFEKAHLPYWRMVNDMPRKISVTIKRRNLADKRTYEAAFERAFDDFVDDWGFDYIFQYLSCSTDFVAFGLGIPYFCMKNSPRWKAVGRGDFLVGRRTPVNPESMGMVAIRQSYTVAELYGYVRDESAHKAGWNVAACKRAILWALDSKPSGSVSVGDWERNQDRIRDNDLGVSAQTDLVDCVVLLVKEFSGKVSRVIFTEQMIETKDTGGDEYLYEEANFSDQMESVIRPMIFEVPLGERTVHGIKGQGIKNYAPARSQNRAHNRIKDAAHWALSINLLNTGNAMQKFPVISMGSVNVFEAGLESGPVFTNLQAGLAFAEYLSQHRAEKLAVYRPSNSPIADANTATAARLAAGIDSQMTQSSAALYLVQVSALNAEQVTRLRRKGSSDPDAKKFVARMRDSLVPDEIIFDAELKVATAASAQAAAPWNRAQTIAEWTQLIGHPMVNDRYILAAKAAQDFGPDAVDQVIISENDPDAAKQARDAMQENVDMGAGVPLPVVPSDNHEAHIGVHLQALNGIVSKFAQTQQADPRSAVTAEIIGQHLQQHIDVLTKEKTRTEFLQRVTPVVKQLTGQIQNMAKAATAPVNGNGMLPPPPPGTGVPGSRIPVL